MEENKTEIIMKMLIGLIGIILVFYLIDSIVGRERNLIAEDGTKCEYGKYTRCGYYLYECENGKEYKCATNIVKQEDNND